MRTQGLSLIMWLGVLSLGCGDDGGTADTEAGTGSDTGGTAGMTTTPMMTTASMTTASMDGSTTDMPPADGTSTGEPPATDTGEPPADSSGTAGGESGTETGGGTTGGADDAYPACDPKAKPECPDPYTGCYEFSPKGFSVCIVDGCEDPDDCPQPSSGTAPVVCGGQQMDLCLLDCSDDQMCPDGMECQEVAQGIARCMWPDA
jgi:hypothetical protein